MKIAFISPRGTERNQQNSCFNEVYRELRYVLTFSIDDIEFMPNLGLLTLAGTCPPDWDLHYIDEDYIDVESAEKIPFDEDWDLVCLSACNNQAYRAYQIADQFRAKGVPVIIGGYHPSALPLEAKRHCDAVFLGEAEETFPEFLQDLKAGTIKPFYRPKRMADLTKVSPRFDIIHGIERFNKFTMLATRGCPHHCEYCCITPLYGHKFRTKTVEQVIREIEQVKALYPNPYISFGDENMFIDKKFAKELLRAMIPLKVRWEAYSDLSVADDPELLELIYESHCVELLVGLESLNPDNLKLMDHWKYQRFMREGHLPALRRIQEAGVGVMGLFIVGYDHDTPDVFEAIRDFIVEAELFDVDFAVLCPLPGTPLFHRLRQEGRILTENWDLYTWMHVNYEPKNMTPEQLQEGLLWLFREICTVEWLLRRKEYMRNLYARLYGDRPAHLAQSWATQTDRSFQGERANFLSTGSRVDADAAKLTPGGVAVLPTPTLEIPGANLNFPRRRGQG